MIAAVDWTSLAPLLIAGVVAVGAYRFVRARGGGAALAELERANGVLEKRLGELSAENRRLAQVVGALEQRTNLEPIAAAVVEQFAAHERRAQERHERELVILDLIARRMGPEEAR